MHASIQKGLDFEIETFGYPTYDWRPPRNRFYSAADFGWVVREFIEKAGITETCPNTETSQTVFFYVKRYLGSLRLTVTDLKLLATGGSHLDRFFGIDALLFAKINGVDCVASIDAYAANDEEVQVEKNYCFSYSDFQSRIYQMKLSKILFSGPWSQTKEAHVRSCMRTGRPQNLFLLMPFDIRRKRGIKEFSRNIVVSLWQQVFEGLHIKYCSISGYTRPVTTQ